MPSGDFCCSQCGHFVLLSHNGSDSWRCARFGKGIDHQDAQRSVCRSWRPASAAGDDELTRFLALVAPGALHHLRTSHLYRTVPEHGLMPLT
ncbi:MAG: hypothetical protein AB1505_36120 [Candidatus Latescibacterota bacterium]